jgi:hypothetical protein
MKIWLVTWIDPDYGRCLSWHTALAAAKAAGKRECRELRRRESVNEPFYKLECVDVPKGKKDFVAWLNERFKYDNG